MTVRYLVDTDWAIHYLNDHPVISQRLNDLAAEGLAVSVVSVAELYEGVYYSTDPGGDERDLQDFLGGVSILGLDVETARVFGRQRGRLRAARTVVGDFDLLIGATALRHDLTLLSNNRRHFELIEGLRLLSL